MKVTVQYLFLAQLSQVLDLVLFYLPSKDKYFERKFVHGLLWSYLEFTNLEM